MSKDAYTLWSRLPIRNKLRFLMAFASLIGPLTLALGVIWYENKTYRNENLQQMQVIANIVSERSTAALIFGDETQLADNLSSLKLRSSVELACIYDSNDRKLASFVREKDWDCPDNPIPHSGKYTSTHLLLTHDIILDGELIGKLHIQASLDELSQHINNFAITAFLVLGVTVVVVLLISNFLQKRITSPLIHLTETVSQITEEKNYQLRAKRISQDEIGKLVEAFNDMLFTIEAQNSEIMAVNENLEKTVDIRTSELQAANKELEAFSYSVSHDLRQPLRAIDGFSEAILEDCSSSLDDLGISYLKRVRSASQRMAKLIDSMLILSRVSRHVLNVSAVDLSNIATKILEDLNETYPESHTNWLVMPGLVVQGDEDLLSIALNNLLGNAWKYSSKEGAPLIEFGVEIADAKQVFYVRDNGVGFDMKYANKLFVAFNRLHAADDFEGSGIGLATVYRVISRHHGSIWAESEPGKGSQFYFTLQV